VAHDFRVEFKAEYGISGTELDALIDSVLEKCVRKIYSRTGLLLLDPGSDVTEPHNGDGSSSFFYARQRPIQSITSIHVSTASPRAYTAAELVDADTYGFNEMTGKVAYLDGGASFAKGLNSIQLIYRPGWAAASVPEEIVDGLFEWTRSIQLRRTHSREGVQSVTAADGTINYQIGAVPPEVLDILEPFTAIRMGW